MEGFWYVELVPFLIKLKIKSFFQYHHPPKNGWELYRQGACCLMEIQFQDQHPQCEDSNIHSPLSKHLIHLYCLSRCLLQYNEKQVKRLNLPANRSSLPDQSNFSVWIQVIFTTFFFRKVSSSQDPHKLLFFILTFLVKEILQKECFSVFLFWEKESLSRILAGSSSVVWKLKLSKRNGFCVQTKRFLHC